MAKFVLDYRKKGGTVNVEALRANYELYLLREKRRREKAMAVISRDGEQWRKARTLTRADVNFIKKHS